MGGGCLWPEMSRLVSTTVPSYQLAEAELMGYQSGLAKLTRSRPCGWQGSGRGSSSSSSLRKHRLVQAQELV